MTKTKQIKKLLKSTKKFVKNSKTCAMDLIENRRSVRKYLEKNIPNDVLKQVLDAGRLAPSWVNVQPWHFIVVRKNKEVLSELSNNQPQVKNADAVIVCVADMGAWNKDRFSEVLKQKGMNDAGIDSLLSIYLYGIN